jgi:hypothetical protein
MNRIRPFDDVEIGVGLNANSVTLLVQQENDKDFYQCPACMETKDGIIVRCQTKASLNTVKACLKNKHDAVLQQVAVHCTVKNKKMNVVSRKQHSFNGEMFVSTNMYTCGALNIYKGVNKRCDRKTRGIKFCHAHREIEDERMLLHNIWDNGKETEILSFDTNNKEIQLVSNIQFSQILCRFVGELDMKNITGSPVKPMATTSKADPDWGNRMILGSEEQANCCVEYNSRFGFVVRVVNDLEADDTLVLYDKVCSPMYIDEHVEAKTEWLMGEKTMAQMDDATFVELNELAKQDKFSGLYMILERPEDRSRGLEVIVSIYNQLIGIYRRDIASVKVVKKAHAEMIDCCVNMFHVEYNRIATETQEVMASKVKEAIQNEQQYEDTEIEHMFDDLLGDTPEANFVKETITKEIIKNRKEGNIMTGTETTKHLQTNTIPQELATKETPRNTNEEGMDLTQMVAQVVREHGIVISDERSDLMDVDFSKLIIMPRNIKASDFHHGYKIHQTKTARKKKYTKLLNDFEYEVSVQVTDSSLEEQAYSVLRVTEAARQLKEYWAEIINGPDVRVSPRRQNQTTSSNNTRIWMMPEDTIQEDATSTAYIKQEVNINTSMLNKPEKYTDVLTDVIDMTMETTRVPIKQKRSKAAFEAWKSPQCIWDQNKAPHRSPNADMQQDPHYILNAKLQQKPTFNWTRYGHQPITGDGNCLFNCLSFMLRGREDEDVAKQLRKEVAGFINKLKGFAKCTTDGTVTGNVTMRMAVHISKQPKLRETFLQRVGPIVDDSKLNEWRLHHHAINFETGEINIPFFSKLIAKSTVETYSTRVAEWRTSATDLGDDTIPLQVMAHLHDVGFIVWRNATFDPEDDIKIKYDQFIYRTVEHHGRIGFPVLNVLYSPPGTVYENFILNIGHYSILTDKFSYFSHFGDDGIITSFPSISPHVWNPSKTVHDIRDSNDYAVLRIKKLLLLQQNNNDTHVWDRFWWVNCARRKVSELLLAEKDEQASTLLQQVIAVERDANSNIPSSPEFEPLPDNTEDT